MGLVEKGGPLFTFMYGARSAGFESPVKAAKTAARPVINARL